MSFFCPKNVKNFSFNDTNEKAQVVVSTLQLPCVAKICTIVTCNLRTTVKQPTNHPSSKHFEGGKQGRLDSV